MDPSVSSISGAITNALSQELEDTKEIGSHFANYSEAPKASTSQRDARAEPTIPTRASVLSVLTNEKAALCFLEDKGVIRPPKKCPYCNGKLLPQSTNLESKFRFTLRCRAVACKAKYSCSVLKGSILMNCKFSKEKFVDFCYHWLLGCKQKQIMAALGMNAGTVTDWSNYLREAVTMDILNNDDCKIGGPGIIVEIDESKFGKRKYHVSL